MFVQKVLHAMQCTACMHVLCVEDTLNVLSSHRPCLESAPIQAISLWEISAWIDAGALESAPIQTISLRDFCLDRRGCLWMARRCRQLFFEGISAWIDADALESASIQTISLWGISAWIDACALESVRSQRNLDFGDKDFVGLGAYR